jgi:DNA-binding NtrC family response regulator
VRAYDYDERRPLWYTWQDLVVETVGVHYFRDEHGLLRFQTTGGGRRISEDKLHEFNATFLGIPKAAVSKRHFDLALLRDLCFKRFVDRLYMVRFSDPAAKEYETIEHAQFQSRQPIDPETERLKEVRSDLQVKIESFDSDIEVRSEDLAEPIQVRFFLRGLSGSLRLRFPKINYKQPPQTDADQVRVFYSLVDVAVSSILDADYYTQQARSLAELEKLNPNLGLFPDLVDLTPYRNVMTSVESRKQFIAAVDVGEHWGKWRPHLRALDELVASDVVATDVSERLAERAKADPRQLARLLSACRDDAKVHRVGALAARALAEDIHSTPADVRAQVEEALLLWALECETAPWDVEVDTGEIRMLKLRWRVEDLALAVLPRVIAKLIAVFHGRLDSANGDAGPLLRKFDWCIAAARALPRHDPKTPASLRLVAADRAPRTVADAARVLKEPVTDLRTLDAAMLAQFQLPMWPLLAASRNGDAIVLMNKGLGAALAVTVRHSGKLFGDGAPPPPADILPGESVKLSLKTKPAAIDVLFEKLGRKVAVTLPIVGEEAGVAAVDNVRVLRTALAPKLRAAQREHRKVIDPGGIVVGSSPALLEVFEHIHHANMTESLAAVLIHGERGTGKTHIAKLLHSSSSRASGAFEVRNAGGAGGDLNIQRGEWIGFGKGHGLQGIHRDGRPGHLMKAHGGTLFVDELAELSRDLQIIFLSVLEGRPVEKVGGESFTPDVRCIFATNADLDAAVASGALRADLLDRIAVKIHMPPLRDRRGDILLLAKHFAGEHRVTDRCLLALVRHDWPGNVRGLEKAMEVAVARKKSASATSVDLDHVELPADVVAATKALDEDACRRELWTLADEIARGEGLERGDGLQKRAGEIMGVGEAQASRMYAAFGLSQAG